MNVFKFIMEVLNKYHYGVYYKVNPVEKLETQDSAPLFRINSVEPKQIEEIIIKEYELFTKKQQRNNKPLQEGLAVNKNSESG